METSYQFKKPFFRVPPYFTNIKRSKKICLQCWKLVEQKRYSLKKNNQT